MLKDLKLPLADHLFLDTLNEDVDLENMQMVMSWICLAHTWQTDGFQGTQMDVRKNF